jgi:hypothetical protein
VRCWPFIHGGNVMWQKPGSLGAHLQLLHVGAVDAVGLKPVKACDGVGETLGHQGSLKCDLDVEESHTNKLFPKCMAFTQADEEDPGSGTPPDGSCRGAPRSWQSPMAASASCCWVNCC